MRRMLLALTSVLALSGCGSGAAADPSLDVRRSWPAAAAGGACHLLDFATVGEAIGVNFDTAGASEKDETYTCALTEAGQSYPDLVLAVTATKIDKTVFEATITPKGSTKVSGLGSIAYRITLGAKSKAGPAIEVGWLSGNKRLMLLRYTFPPDAAESDVDAFPAKIVDLAKKIDETMV